MATAAVARPAAAHRRRDAPRITLTNKRANMENGVEITGTKRRKLDEPHVISKDHILRKFAGRPPSLVLHLHTSYFRFDTQEGNYSLEGPMKFILEHVRESRVPHEMLEELLVNSVPWYDGCLIVEIHNHRTTAGKSKGRQASGVEGNEVKYSMHNYSNYITPSGLAPYPKKAKEEAAEKAAAAGTAQKHKSVEDKNKTQDGPHVSTVVLFPTPLSRHREMQILAQTPADQMRNKRNATPSAAQPSTPQLSVPPTPITATGNRSPSGENKMCLEEKDFYQFESDLLLATQPPLLLGTVDGPESTLKVLDTLSHPLHQAMPPSEKTRKRTTAELAADDEKAAEAERRMLIMDERIKPSSGHGAAANDNAGTAAAIGFSRFKTIQMVKEKHEEEERKKKEKEAQEALARRQHEEAAAAQQKQQQMQAERSKLMMQQRQQQAAQARAQHQLQAQQQALMNAAQQNHAHPQGNMMMNAQQNFQNVSMAHGSPIIRQQTPSMMQSSPMPGQGGFATTSQGAGSPPRPTSATIPNAMQRQISQQQHQSRNATPQIPQATPNMGGLPNRQMSQTPRMAQVSPAPGTPASATMPNMAMQTPQNMTAEQAAMIHQQRLIAAQMNNMQNGATGQNPALASMTPEQIQNIRQQQQMRQQQMSQNPQMAQAMAQRQAMLLRQQQQHLAQQQRIMQQQGTPQMSHAHPQQNSDGSQMNPQQAAAFQQRQRQMQQQAAQTVQNLAAQYNGLQNIPPQVAQSLPAPAQLLLRQHMQRAQAARAQAMAARAQQAQQHGQAVAGTSGGDPEYMQTLRAHQAMLAQQQAQQAQQGGMGMNMGNVGGGMGNQKFNNQGGDNLSMQFQAMQRALQNQGGQGNGGMG